MKKKVIKELKEYLEKSNPYAEDIFLTTTAQAGKLLREKGLTDIEITAISGALCRLGYWVAQKQIEHYFED